MKDNKQPKWISVDKQLPDNDRTVLVFDIILSNYCNGGRESHEIVTDWCQIPGKK